MSSDKLQEIPLEKTIPAAATAEAKEEGDREDVITPELEAMLHTDPLVGLSSAEAASRLTQFGPNELPEKRVPMWKRLGSYFIGPLAYLIEIAIVLSAILEDWVDMGVILFLLLLNAAIGFFEEGKADSALSALKATISQQSKVFRDGQLQDVDSVNLVPGDIIALRIGDIVPADCRLLGIGSNGQPVTEGLLIDEAALTGESLPSEKHAGQTAYSSSVCKQGQMRCMVIKTGDKTFIGRAASLIASVDDIGEFQKVVNNIGNFLIYITVGLAGILLIVQLATTEPLNKTTVFGILQNVLVIVIAAIPVGLPTVLSVTMAVGAESLAKKQVVVKKLPAIEELAAVSILCSDKTGTLTLNQLTTDKPWLCTNSETGQSYTEEDLMRWALLCSEHGTQDAIEKAVVTFATKTLNLGDSPDVPGYTQNSFTPFNPTTKYTTSTVTEASTGRQYEIVKGAPPNVIALVGGSMAPVATQAVNDLASRGLRALAVARTVGPDPSTKDYEMVGLISLLDPPRPDSAETIKRCNELGVEVKMITGDQTVIAKEVAQRLALDPEWIMDADVLDNGDIGDPELAKLCEEASGFAHVVPEHKFKVVAVLQNAGRQVAMTGDGVNDAPALKKANVGFAVEGCTEAARSAANVVLLSPGLSTIVDGIKTSRGIFQRMRAYALYRIAASIHILLFLFISILALDFTLPSLLVIILAVLNDAATLGLAYDHNDISQKPDKWRLTQLFFMSFALALFMLVTSFAFYLVAAGPLGLGPFVAVNNNPNPMLQSAVWLQLSTVEHFLILSTRQPSWLWQGTIAGWVLIACVLLTLLLPFFFCVFGIPGLVASIGWAWSVGITVYCAILTIGCDIIKVLLYKYWSFQVTATLIPTKKNKEKLSKKNKAAEIEREKAELKLQHEADMMKTVARMNAGVMQAVPTLPRT